MSWHSEPVERSGNLMNGHASMLHVKYIRTVASRLFSFEMNEFAAQPELKVEVE